VVAVCGAGVESDFSPAATASTGAFSVDAAFMLLERHELGIHAVWADGRNLGTDPVTGQAAVGFRSNDGVGPGTGPTPPGY